MADLTARADPAFDVTTLVSSSAVIKIKQKKEETQVVWWEFVPPIVSRSLAASATRNR